MSRRHSEIAYSGPALVFAASIPMIVIYKPLAWVLFIGCWPCCLVRDWWVKR